MGFCYSHEAFLPYDCSFPIYYFIISLPISLLSLSFFLPVSLPKQKGLDRSANLAGDRDRIGGLLDRWRCDWIGGSLDSDAEKLRKIGLETRKIGRDRSSR
jgi:hypothetical protein